MPLERRIIYVYNHKIYHDPEDCKMDMLRDELERLWGIYSIDSLNEFTLGITTDKGFRKRVHEVLIEFDSMVVADSGFVQTYVEKGR